MTIPTTKEADPSNLLIALLMVAAISVVTVVGTYALFFRGPLSNDPALWGQFGDYIGGTLNPILGFISVIALILTLFVQTRQLAISQDQLRLSRQELEATRLELSRTADAQKATAEALSIQAAFAVRSARLAAIGTALDETEKQLRRVRGGSPDSAAESRYQVLTKRKLELTSELSALVSEIRAAK